MEKIENVWTFYQNTVQKILSEKNIANNFFEQAIIGMLLEKELEQEIQQNEQMYELLLYYHLGYSNHAFIQSNIGRQDIVDNELQKVINSFSQLKNILRTGWIKRNVPLEYQETDIEHIMQMISLAAPLFNNYSDLKLDRKKVYEMILVHEIGEIKAGDIREGTKEHQSKHILEEQAVINVFEKINTGDYFISLWEEFEERKCEEAIFTYQLDKIDPVLKAKILDKRLGRDDLFLDFFNFEEQRKTFKEGKVKELFYYIKGRRI